MSNDNPEPFDVERAAREIELAAPEFESRDRPWNQAGLTLVQVARGLLGELSRITAERDEMWDDLKRIATKYNQLLPEPAAARRDAEQAQRWRDTYRDKLQEAYHGLAELWGLLHWEDGEERDEIPAEELERTLRGCPDFMDYSFAEEELETRAARAAAPQADERTSPLRWLPDTFEAYTCEPCGKNIAVKYEATHNAVFHAELLPVAAPDSADTEAAWIANAKAVLANAGPPVYATSEAKPVPADGGEVTA